MRIKRDKRDDVFSKLVRERANWTCECCGKYFIEEDRPRLQCSHIFSRRHKSVRWHPLNAVAHCFACHQRLGENPIEFADWAEEKLGFVHYNQLKKLYRKTVKLTKADLEDIHKRLKKALDLMKRKRDSGITERIEFKSPYLDY